MPQQALLAQQARLAALHASAVGVVLLGPLPAIFSALTPPAAVDIHTGQPLPMWNTDLPDLWTEGMLAATRFMVYGLAVDIDFDLF